MPQTDGHSALLRLFVTESSITGGIAQGAVSLRRGSIDPCEETGGRTGCLGLQSAKFHFERSSHTDAVFVHFETLVRFGDRKVPSCHDVVLVGSMHQSPTEKIEEPALPVFDDVQDVLGLFCSVSPHGDFSIEAADSQRDDCKTVQIGVLVQNSDQRSLQLGTAVDSWTDDDLAVDSNAASEELLEPTKTHRTSIVAKKC